MKRSLPSVQGVPLPKAFSNFTKVLSWGILISVLFPLAVYMFLGNYVRYFADDYSAAGDLLRLGFWNAQANWYMNWTGSYLYSFLITASALGGVTAARWLPAVAMFLWFILVFLLLDLIFRVLKISVSKVWIGILSGALVFTTIREFDNYTQMIFWETGIIAYLSNILVFILIVLYFVSRFWLSNKRVQPWEYGVVPVVFFILGGSSETWIIMQVALFAFSILVALLFRKRLPHADLLKMLVAGFLATGLSFLVTILAPGNANHSSTMEDLSLQRIIQYLFVSFADVPKFLTEWISKRTLLTILITLTGFLCGFQAHLSIRDVQTTYLKFGGAILLGAYLMLWMGFFPGYTVFGVRPPDRALFTSMFVFLLAYALFFFLIGWMIGSLLSAHVRSMVYGLLALCLAAMMYQLPVKTGISQLKLIPALRLYAQLWDERDAFFRRAGEEGQMDVVVPTISYHPELAPLKSTIWLVGELEESPANWKNNAASIYYGLRTITGQMNPSSYEFK